MTKLTELTKINNFAQGIRKQPFYPWNTTIYTGLMGQVFNGILSLINQVVYYNNPHPKYKTPAPYQDSSSKIYVKMGKNAMSSTMLIGSPFI